VLAPIAVGRLVLFEFDGTSLRMVPSLELDTAGRMMEPVPNHPNRVLAQTKPESAAWRHVFGLPRDTERRP
jgi:hypothetical protein